MAKRPLGASLMAMIAMGDALKYDFKYNRAYGIPLPDNWGKRRIKKAKKKGGRK